MNQMDIKMGPNFWWIRLLEKIFGVQLIIISTHQYRTNDTRNSALKQALQCMHAIFECGYLGGMERLANHLQKRSFKEAEMCSCYETLHGPEHHLVSKEVAKKTIAYRKLLEAELSA